MAENIVQSALSKVRQTANQILRPVQQATQDTRGFVQQGRFTPLQGLQELRQAPPVRLAETLVRPLVQRQVQRVTEPIKTAVSQIQPTIQKLGDVPILPQYQSLPPIFAFGKTIEPSKIGDITYGQALEYGRESILQPGLRIAPELALTAKQAITKQPEVIQVPQTPAGKFFLGEQPLEALQVTIPKRQREIEPVLEMAGLPKGLAGPLAIGGVITGRYLDLLPGVDDLLTKGVKKGITEVAQAGLKRAVSEQTQKQATEFVAKEIEQRLIAQGIEQQAARTQANTEAKQLVASRVEALKAPVQTVTSAPSAELVPRGGVGGLPPTPPAGKPPAVPQPFDTQRYIAEQTQRQQAQQLPTPTRQKIKDFVNGIRVRLEDSTFYITKLLDDAERKYNFRVTPKSDVRLQIDRALRTDSLASQFVKDNSLDKIIQQVPDINAFNQYLIAKQANRVSELGKATGRNIEADKRLVQELQTTYEPFAQQVRTYNNNLLQYAVESGMVSEELADKLRSIYPDYVPLKRVLDEVQPGVEGKGQAIASVSTNKVLQRLKGSEKAIRNPIESIVENTATVFAQGERNKAAKMIFDYRNLPNNPFGIRELAPGEKIGTKSTISFFDNGTKRTFEVNKDVAEAAKNLNKEQMNIYGKILSIPTRILKIGTVGFNAPFILTNLVRDQATATIFGSKPLSTSLVNPGNFLKAFYGVFKQDDLYENWVRNAGSFTSMDIGRETVAPTVAKIRAGRSLPSKIAYIAKNPAELFRAVEDFVGKAEEITRLQQYRGTYDALIREGRTVADAQMLAAKAARENTANFARSGAWGQVLNGAIPFFNARIQGTRALREAFMRDPKGFTTRFMLTIGGPVATATVWNLSDPQRRAAYEDIQEFEKENNLIILPPVPEQDENGRWKAIKIPMAPGLSNIASTIRRPIEGTQKLDAEGFRKLATDFLTVTTSVDLSSPNKTVGEILPQAIKPLVEAITNVNLFTGRPIVPTYMQGLPPSQQVRENTSGTAREIGKLLNMSPIMVENMIRTMAGGVGSQLLNLSDQILFRAGAIPQEQVGGENAFANIIRRFSLASGGVKADEIYKDIEDTKAKKQVLNNDLKLAVASGADETALQLASSMTPNQAIDVLRSKNEKEIRDSLTSTQKALQSMTKDQREQYVATRPELQKDLLAVQAAELGTQGVGGTVVQQLLVQNAMQDLSPVAPTSPYQKLTWERDVFSKIGSIEQREGIAKADKDGAIDQLLGKIGLSRNDYDYYKVAKENNEIKTAYVQEQIGNIVRQGGGPQQIFDFLANNQLQVRGNKIVTSGVLTNLVDAGIITSNQSDELKKLEVSGSITNPTVSTKPKKARKLRARKPRLAKVKAVRLKQVKLPKPRAIKLTPIKPVRFARLKQPKTSRRAKLQTIRVRS